MSHYSCNSLIRIAFFPLNMCFFYSFTCDSCIEVSAYIELLVVFILDALKSVFFRASLAHFEKTGAPVWSERQLLQHDVLRRVDFPPKIHLHIWTRGDKQKTKELVYTIYKIDLISDKTNLFSYFPSSHLSNLIEHKLYSHTKKSLLQRKKKRSTWIADLVLLPIWWMSNYLPS